MVTRIGGQTVTIVRRERSPAGPAVPTGARVPVEGCFVEPRDPTRGDGQQRLQYAFRVYGSEQLRTARSADLLEVDGWLVGTTGPGLLRLLAMPKVWPNLRGQIDHVEVDITHAGEAEPGEQTVTVFERVRVQHGEYGDGPATVYSRCALDSLDPTDTTETTSDGRTRETQRWRLRAPAGFRASSTAQCVVEPGPVATDGAPVRLSFAGTAQPHWGADGVEDHVTAVLRAIG